MYLLWILRYLRLAVHSGRVEVAGLQRAEHVQAYSCSRDCPWGLQLCAVTRLHPPAHQPPDADVQLGLGDEAVLGCVDELGVPGVAGAPGGVSALLLRMVTPPGPRTYSGPQLMSPPAFTAMAVACSTLAV